MADIDFNLRLPDDAKATRIRAIWDNHDASDLPDLYVETGDVRGKGTAFEYLQESAEVTIRMPLDWTPEQCAAFYEKMKAACDVALERCAAMAVKP